MTLHRRTFCKRLGLGMAGMGLLTSLPGCLAPEHSSSGHLPRSRPEEQGVSSDRILAFLEAAEKSGYEFHSFMAVRHGHVVAEGWWKPYRPTAKHMLYSLSKSFTSTAVGLAVSEGKLDIHAPVVSFFPDKLPADLSENLKALQVRHLLMMSVGRAHDSMPFITKESDWVKSFLNTPIEHPPGSVFLYDSGATFMLSAIVQKITRQRIIDYLRPRLFEPLEISGMTWETNPQGINTGGWGLSVRTEALAKFGQLYLQNGMWNGRQLLPAAWVREATTFKIQQRAAQGKDLETVKKSSDWHQGYCYQFWRCRHNAFRGDGAYGQFMIVMPDQDAVVAITCETADMQGELNLVWDHLLSAMNESASGEGGLVKRLNSLALALPTGNASSPISDKISGRVFQLEPNSLEAKTVSFQFTPGRSTFVLTDSKASYAVHCAPDRWLDGDCNVPGTPPRLTVGELRPSKVAASAFWKDENTLEMIWRYYETPHHDIVTCRFAESSVSVEFKRSVPGSKETRPVLEGRV